MFKSVLITGCSAGGIGHALAVSFQKRGLLVFATARKLSSMSTLADLPNIHMLELDVTSAESVTAACKVVSSKTGNRLDYVVNNAGRGYTMPALDTDIEEGKKLFDINVWGVLRMIQTFSPLLMEAKGTVINIGSIAGYLHPPWSSLYNASKAALHMMSETMRIELSPLGISVVTVVTGSIDTEFHANMNTPLLPSTSHYSSAQEKLKVRAIAVDDGIKRGPAEDFAKAVVTDVLNGKNGKIWHGKNTTIVWLANAIMPISMIDRLLMEGTGLDDMGKAKKLK